MSRQVSRVLKQLDYTVLRIPFEEIAQITRDIVTAASLHLERYSGRHGYAVASGRSRC